MQGLGPFAAFSLALVLRVLGVVVVQFRSLDEDYHDDTKSTEEMAIFLPCRLDSISVSGMLFVWHLASCQCNRRDL
jgi:hypothetical protein